MRTNTRPGNRFGQAVYYTIAGKRMLRSRRREKWFVTLMSSGCKTMKRLAVQALLASVSLDLNGMDR